MANSSAMLPTADLFAIFLDIEAFLDLPPLVGVHLIV